MAKKILFLTGTRADFGKIKALIKKVDATDLFECSLFVTGMHTLAKYGYTVDEVYNALKDHRLSTGFRSVSVFMNQVTGEAMEQVLANTITGLSRYVHEFHPDMIVVHGDRVEALAGAIVGALRNIFVAHIEGGELSGTVDEIIRHAVSKLSHFHFVANKEAAARLKQLGEKDNSVFVIGSPDIDIMLSSDLPTVENVLNHYDIPFQNYGIVLYHPVTTDQKATANAADELVSALLAAQRPFVVIHPNNDEGCEAIFAEYKRFDGNPRFKCFPSIRMESFLVLLKNADFIIGNSSAGIREAPVYGIYSINIDARQSGRFYHKSIINTEGTYDSISECISRISKMPQCEPCYHFGKGDSAARFIEAVSDSKIWKFSRQKQFIDIPMTLPSAK